MLVMAATLAKKPKFRYLNHGFVLLKFAARTVFAGRPGRSHFRPMPEIPLDAGLPALFRFGGAALIGFAKAFELGLGAHGAASGSLSTRAYGPARRRVCEVDQVLVKRPGGDPHRGVVVVLVKFAGGLFGALGGRAQLPSIWHSLRDSEARLSAASRALMSAAAGVSPATA